jgi:hypothetical protein
VEKTGGNLGDRSFSPAGWQTGISTGQLVAVVLNQLSPVEVLEDLVDTLSSANWQWGPSVWKIPTSYCTLPIMNPALILILSEVPGSTSMPSAAVLTEVAWILWPRGCLSLKEPTQTDTVSNSKVKTASNLCSAPTLALWK